MDLAIDLWVDSLGALAFVFHVLSLVMTGAKSIWIMINQLDTRSLILFYVNRSNVFWLPSSHPLRRITILGICNGIPVSFEDQSL
jgi:hypothetical protein